MPKVKTFSLINVFNTRQDGTVDGYWIQNHTGTLKSAHMVASQTEDVNSNKITIAVVENVNHPTPKLEVWTNLRPL